MSTIASHFIAVEYLINR